jgi:hypothetical protein
LELCADQLAALLVFKNLKDRHLDQILSGVLLHRVAERVILSRCGGFITEDGVSNCIAVILKGAQEDSIWRYEGLGQAINYFTTVYRNEERRRAVQDPHILEGSPQAQSASDLPSTRPLLFTELAQTLEHEAAMQYWILQRLKEDRQCAWSEVAAMVLERACSI